MHERAPRTAQAPFLSTDPLVSGIDVVRKRIDAKGPKRVLALDGGGVRGALAVGILGNIERTLRARLGRPDLVLADYFDLIGGTSTGAIIAAPLALGASCADLEDLWHSLGARCFGSSALRAPLLQTRFDPRNIQRVLEEEMGELTLGSAPWRTAFGAVAKRVDTGSPWLFTNSPYSKYWFGDAAEIATEPDPAKRKTLPNRDYSLAKVVQASAAAPFFFDLVPIEVGRGQTGIFFDGAISPHVNPAFQLAMAALVPAYGFNWTAGPDDLLVVSVGTGSPRPRKPEWVDHRLMALVKAMTALLSLTYDTGHFSISLMQWLGRSPQPWQINDEVGHLGGVFPRDPLWTFLRYDAPLESSWLQPHLGYEPKPEWLRLMERLDAHHNIPALLDLGKTVGARVVEDAHFARVFDPPLSP